MYFHLQLTKECMEYRGKSKSLNKQYILTRVRGCFVPLRIVPLIFLVLTAVVEFHSPRRTDPHLRCHGYTVLSSEHVSSVSWSEDVFLGMCSQFYMTPAKFFKAMFEKTPFVCLQWPDMNFNSSIYNFLALLNFLNDIG